MNKNFAVRITIADLARLCHSSQTHFMRVFKKQMKMTAYAYLEQVRMFHALEGIRHSAASIAEVAVSAGFYDHSAFVKRFKKFTGSTPLRHRREYQAKGSVIHHLPMPGL
jgi:transcriptional regulator GlxA family with amidase domain